MSSSSSSSSSTRKPPLPSNVNRRSQPPSPSPSRASGRSPTPSSIPSASAHGSAAPPTVARRNTLSHRRDSSASISSPLSARSAVKTRPDSTDETELENAAILEDLKGRLAKSESAAEAAAENYEKQIKALQMRLEESLEEQSKQEEALHAKDDQIETLEIQVKELIRSKRDQENIFEAERIAAQQEKEELLDRETELSAIIQRLKDGKKSQRRTSYDSTAEDSFNQGFAPASHSPSPTLSNLVLQKDKIIEALRSELAEAQHRLTEAAHFDGTQLQQLEAQLLEARMTNARLMEDNEGYQLLLSSAALNGDFPRGDYITHAFTDHESDADSEPVKVPGSPSQATSLGGLNLADELEEADKEESDRVRKLEADLKQLKETNKAMSLYINGIIERILQHKDSEAILDKSASLEEKPAPPKPVEAPTGFLQRTKSLVTGSASRPAATIPEHSGAAAAAPFRPVARSHTVHGPPGGGRQHKRSQSDVSAVSYLNRRDGVITPRADTFFGGQTGEHYTRSNRRARDSTISIDSGVSDTDSHMGSSIGSPITSSASSIHDRYPSDVRRTFGPVAGGNKLRPLTLVQKTQGGGLTSPTTGRKFSMDWGASDNQNKRSSWIGNWFNRAGANGTAPNSSGSDTRSLTSPIEKSTVVFEGKDVE